MANNSSYRQRALDILNGNTTTNTVYQQNVANVQAPVQQEWNTRSMLGRIYDLSKTDPAKASDMMSTFRTLQQSKDSKYYNPYTAPTNRAVQNLAAYGVDTSVIDDAFFERNSYLTDYLIYDGTTNTPTKPNAKKGTAAQKAAYEYYQIWKSEAATKKAEQQWSALQQELNHWANRKELNLSDDEIIDRIDWSKYGELTGMDEKKLTQPPEYNRAIGYSRDALYGVLWQARNPEYTGDIYGAMANSYNGVGNVWQDDPEITAKRTPGTAEFNPYSLGSVGIDDACLYYGENTFDENFLQEHQADAYSNDSTRKKMYGKVYDAVQNTKKAQEAVDALNRWIDRNAHKWQDEDTAKKKIDDKLEKGKIKLDGVEYDISILNKLDASLGKNGEPGSGNMISTSGTVNYKYNQVLDDVYGRVEENRNRKNGNEFAGSIANDVTTNAQTGEKMTGTGFTGNSESSAITNAQNAQIADAADAIGEENMTPAEQGAFRNMTLSGAFATVKSTLDRVITAGIPLNSELMAKVETASIGELSTSVLDGAGLMQDYAAMEADLAKWEKQKADFEEAATALADKARWEKAGFDTESYGRTMDLASQPTWDMLTDSQKAIMQSMTVDASESEIQEQYNEFIEANRAGREGLTEEERNALNNYQDALNYIDRDQKYLEENREAYDEAAKKQDQAMRKYQTVISMMKKSGVDTSKMEDAYKVTQFFTQFTEYEPTQWNAYNMYHDTYQALYAQEGNWEEQYKEAQGYDEKISEMIDLGEWALEYAERNGIAIPGGIRENIQRWVDALQREHDDFEYLSLMDDIGFKEDAEKGKTKLLANSESFDWNAYEESGGIEGMPLFYMLPEETKKELIQKDEKYRNGEAFATDMVDQYLSSVAYFDLDHRTFNNLGFLNGATNAADIMTDYEEDTYYFLLETQGAEAAEKYYQHLADDYGVLQTRSAELTQKGADALAESGFWGRRAADAISMLLSPIAAIGSLYYMADTEIKKARGERVEINPNNVNLTANIYKKEARQKIQEEIKEAYKDNPALQTIMSGLQEIISNRGDSLVNAVTFGPLFRGISSGIANEFMSALPMAFTAATDAVADAKQKGASDTDLLGVFLATMLAEAGTETISIHNIKEAFTAGQALTGGTIKDFLLNWVTESGISEMVGESLNDVIENLADELALGDLSEFQESVDRYMQEEHMSEEDAIAAARRDQVMGVLHTALISYLSPGMDIVSYGAGYLRTLNAYRQLAKQRQKIGYSESMFELMRRDKQAAREAQQRAAEEGQQTTEQAAEATETAPETATETAPESEAGVPETAGPEGVPTPGNPQAAAAPVQTGGNVASITQAAAQVATATVDTATADYSLLDSAKAADAASRSAAIASVLDMVHTPESNDTAKAVAANLDLVAEIATGNRDSVGFLQDMLLGADAAGIDGAVVKQAIRNAALSKSSEALKTVQTEEFRTADLDVQARMLASTVEQDAASTTVQSEIETAVHEDRIAVAMGEAIASGATNPLAQAQAAVRTAQNKVNNARDMREQKLGIVQAKSQALDEARDLYTSDPSNKDYQGVYNAALDELNAATQVLDEYDQMVGKAEAELAKAEDSEKTVREEVTKTIREQAEAKVAEEDAQRAQAKAEAEQAAQVEAEQQAQAQAEEDERTGKTQEEQDYGQIDSLVDSMGLSEEDSEDLKQQLRDRRDQQAHGTVNMDGKLTDAQSMLALAAFQRKLGIPIMFSDNIGDADGKYDPKSGIIYLNAKKAQDGSLRLGRALLETTLHEITHSMESTKSYEAYDQAVIAALFGEGDSFDQAAYDAAIQDARVRYYNAVGQELSPEDARREIVADFAKYHLTDSAVVQRMMDAGLGGRIRNTLHNINQAIKNFFHMLTGEDRTMAENLRKAERLYQKAMDERARSAVHPNGDQFSIPQFVQAAGLQFHEGSEDHDMGVYRYVYDENGQKMRDEEGNYLLGEKVEEVTPEMMAQTPIGMLVRKGIPDKATRESALKMFSDLMSMVLKYQDSDLVWEIAGSTLESTFSALKSNSDPQYQTTIDFGTVCAKTQAILDVMSEVMLNRVKEGKTGGLTRQEIMKIYNATHNAGLSVPCPVCYVFSRWMGVPSMLGQMSQFQHDFVALKEDGTIDVEETKRRANDYIENAHIKYKDKKGVADAKTSIMNRLKSRETSRKSLTQEISDLTKMIENESTDAKERAKAEKQREAAQQKLDTVLAEMTDLDRDLGEVEAYNWITQALCLQQRNGNSVTNVLDENGKYEIDPDFELTPDEILFDLRRTGEFAKYKKNWKYRTTRGAGMGKAILPYSGASIGDILYGSPTRRLTGNAWLDMDSKQATLRWARARAKKQNLVGGQRLQSTSDFRPEWGLDYIMAFLELQAAQSNAQMYTKVAEAVDFFASVGADVNLSIMGYGDGFHEATPEEIALSKKDTKEGKELKSRMGTLVDEDGVEHTYVLDFSDVTGMEYGTAKQKTKDWDNVQMILVGLNDKHIRLAMANDDIDFIIPWHSSGNSKSVLSQLVASVGERLSTSSDYTDSQTDQFLSHEEIDENGKKITVDDRTPEQKMLWEARMKILRGEANKPAEKGGLTVEERRAVQDNPFLKDLYHRFYEDKKDKCYGVKLDEKQAKQIFPYEYWDTTSTRETADVNGQRFVAYCEALGLKPRFSQFKDEKGYWKLLIDRRMYDREGNYREQQKIDVTKAKVGALNEEGKLTGSQLPMKTSAKYGPEYQDQMDRAVETAQSMLEDPFGPGLIDDTEGEAAESEAEESDEEYSVPNRRKMTDAELDDLLRQAGIAAPIHDTVQAAENLGWTTRKTRAGITLVFDENGERIGTLEKGQIVIDPDNPNAEAYKEALNGVRFAPGETGAMLEGENPAATTSLGTAVRAFAADDGMLEKSDELDDFAKAVVHAQNTYFPDTNAEQIQRAVRWIRSLKDSPESDGYAEAFQAVTDPSFDYRSADGQARMVAVMAMAVAKKDKLAQAALTDSFMRQGTDLGRALQARKMFLLMTPEGRKQSLENTMRGLQQELYAKGYKGEPLTLSEWVLAAASVAENPEDFERVQEAAAAELAEQMPVSWKDKLRSWRMLSMLMNPRTHIRNILGNFLFVPAVGIKNKLAAVMELGVKKGNKTKTLSPFLSKEARDFARADAEKQEKVLRGEAKYGQETRVKQEQKIFGTGKGILSRTGGKVLQFLSEINSKALEGEDWLFLKGHYRRALGGWMMANGYTAAQLEANPKLLEKGRAYAIQEAQKATYRDFNQLAQTLNQVSRKGGAAGFIVDAMLPFKKTPANILKRGIEYSPLGIVKNVSMDLYHLKQYMDYQNGKLKALPTNAISPTQFIDNLCSGLTGSAIMAAGYLLANSGIVRCGLKDDDDELDKLEGAQEYAFEISIGGMDVSFTMDWAAPMSMPFFVGAAIQNQLSEQGELNAQEIVNAISNIAEPVFNLSMLDGVNTLFKTSQNDDTTTLTQIGAKVLSNYISSYLPSAMGAVARTYDPIRRKAYVKSGEGTGVMGTFRYAIEQAENKIPGQSKNNIPVRDAFGRTSGHEETWLRALENFILPGYVSVKKDDPVVEELRRVYGKTGNPHMIPKLPDKSFQAGGQSVKLEAEQYDQLTQERGETAYNLIQALMDNEYYKGVPAEDQEAMIEDAWTFATQNAKYNVNQNANVDKWVLNSRTNPVQGIVNKHKEKVDSEYKTGYKVAALEAVRDGNNANLEVCLEKLEEAGVKNPESTVKTYVANAYRPDYIRAYQDEDWDKVNEIETILENSDLDFDSDDFESWIDTMYKQTMTDEDDE